MKSIIPKKGYSYIDAIWDTVFLATPFLSMALIYYIFNQRNPDRLLSGMTSTKKSMKVESMKDIKVRFNDVAGMEGAKK